MLIGQVSGVLYEQVRVYWMFLMYMCIDDLH